MTLISQKPLQKPRNVLYAEWALWVWTTWACLFGMYQSWAGLPQLESQINTESQGMITIAPQTILDWAVVGYLAGAAVSVWFILKIGEGKRWARSSFMWGFALEIVWLAIPPYHGLGDYLTDIPDLALQGYALHLLYTKPGSGWFLRAPQPQKA